MKHKKKLGKLNLMESLEARTLLAGINSASSLDDEGQSSKNQIPLQGLQADGLSSDSPKDGNTDQEINWATVNLRNVDWEGVNYNSIDPLALGKNLGSSVLLDFIKTYSGERAFVSADGALGGFSMNSFWLGQSLISATAGEVLHGGEKSIPWNDQYNLPDVNAPLSSFYPLGLDLLSSLVAQASSASYSFAYNYPGYEADYLRLTKPIWITALDVSKCLNSVVTSKAFQAKLPLDILQGIEVAKSDVSATGERLINAARGIDLNAVRLEIGKLAAVANAEGQAQNNIQGVLVAVSNLNELLESAPEAGADMTLAVNDGGAATLKPSLEFALKEAAQQWQRGVGSAAERLNEADRALDVSNAELKAAKESYNAATARLANAEERLEGANVLAKSHMQNMRNWFVGLQMLSVAIKKLPKAAKVTRNLNSENAVSELGAFSAEYFAAVVQQISGIISYGGQLWLAKKSDAVGRTGMGFVVDLTFLRMQSIFTASSAVHTLAVDWNNSKYQNTTASEYVTEKLYNANFPIDTFTDGLSLALTASGTYGSVDSLKGSYSVDKNVRMMGSHLMVGIVNQVLNPFFKCMWTVVVKPSLQSSSWAQQLPDVNSWLDYEILVNTGSTYITSFLEKIRSGNEKTEL